MLKRASVISSNIEEVKYDTDSHELHVVFKSGATYIYKDVSDIEFLNFTTAKSVGAYFNASIKNNYAYERA